MNLETLITGIAAPKDVPPHIQPDYGTVHGWVVAGDLPEAARHLYKVLRDAPAGVRKPGGEFYASAGLIFAWASAASDDWRENQEFGHFAVVCWSEAAELGFPRSEVERLAPHAWMQHIEDAWSESA